MHTCYCYVKIEMSKLLVAISDWQKKTNVQTSTESVQIKMGLTRSIHFRLYTYSDGIHITYSAIHKRPVWDRCWISNFSAFNSQLSIFIYSEHSTRNPFDIHTIHYHSVRFDGFIFFYLYKNHSVICYWCYRSRHVYSRSFRLNIICMQFVVSKCLLFFITIKIFATNFPQLSLIFFQNQITQSSWVRFVICAVRPTLRYNPTHNSRHYWSRIVSKPFVIGKVIIDRCPIVGRGWGSERAVTPAITSA